ncbi:MAG: hypothetical protein K5773_00320 [Pseudobutyrivibrio sp.]|nr:hypothetical protein [Pseudobutyrivibrio sp.]
MKTRNNGSRIFLTELLFAILFFIMIAAVCVQAFAQSYIKSKEATNLTNAVEVVTNAAELYLSGNLDGDFTEYYDKDWNQVRSAGEYKFTGIITDAENGVESMSLVVCTLEDDAQIYSLVVEKAVK